MMKKQDGWPAPYIVRIADWDWADSFRLKAVQYDRRLRQLSTFADPRSGFSRAPIVGAWRSTPVAATAARFGSKQGKDKRRMLYRLKDVGAEREVFGIYQERREASEALKKIAYGPERYGDLEGAMTTEWVSVASKTCGSYLSPHIQTRGYSGC